MTRQPVPATPNPTFTAGPAFCGQGIQGGGYEAQSGYSSPVAETSEAALLDDHARRSRPTITPDDHARSEAVFVGAAPQSGRRHRRGGG